MNSLPMVIAFAAGILLGAFYFGSLWWVVSRVPKTQMPEVLMVASYFVRTTVVLAGFYFVMGGSWERLIVCLVGFLIARTVMIRILRAAEPKSKLPQT